MNISNLYKEEAPKKPLHEQRWEESKMKNSLNALDKSIEAYMKDSSKNSLINNNGKDLKIKPLIYYNLNDCVSKSLGDSDIVEKGKKNIDIVRTKVESKGGRLAENKDLKGCIGEFQTSKTVKVGIDQWKFHNVVKQWNGTICIFEILERKFGSGNMRRNGFVLNKGYVIFHGKEGVKLHKELILNHAFWWGRHRSDEQ